MSRKGSFRFAARLNAVERSHKSCRHLKVESLEGRDLLTTLSVNIADSNCAGEGDHNYCEIQDAIDVAEEGDVIEVASGTYERIQIRTDNLTLRAVEGAAPRIDAEGAISAVELAADGVTVQGLTVEAALRGFDVSGNSNTISANHAESIGLFGDGSIPRAAFFLTGGESNAFSDNTAEDVRAGFFIVDSDSNILEDNHVEAHVVGYYMRDSDLNTLRRNTALNSATEGFRLRSGCDFNVLVENTAEGNELVGIAVLSSSNNTIMHNMLRGNGTGISVFPNKWQDNPEPTESNILEGNIVEDNGGWGVVLGETDSNRFRGNVIEGNGIDAFAIVTGDFFEELFGDSESNTFQDNIAIGNGGFAFSVPDADHALANSFENNRCVENASGATSHDVAVCALPRPGDSNLDGVFNSTDLIQIFQVGEYEDSATENSTWRDGDWNGDKEFDSADLVLAFQDGGYSAAALAGAMPGLDLNPDLPTPGQVTRPSNEVRRVAKVETSAGLLQAPREVETELAHRDSLFEQIGRQEETQRSDRQTNVRQVDVWAL